MRSGSAAFGTLTAKGLRTQGYASSRLQQLQRLTLEPCENAFQFDALGFEHVGVGADRHRNRLPQHERDATEWQRHLRGIPARRRPVGCRLQMEWQDGVAGGLREPDGARLRDARGPARAVEG